MRLLEEFWYGNIEPTEYGVDVCKECTLYTISVYDFFAPTLHSFLLLSCSWCASFSVMPSYSVVPHVLGASVIHQQLDQRKTSAFQIASSAVASYSPELGCLYNTQAAGPEEDSPEDPSQIWT